MFGQIHSFSLTYILLGFRLLFFVGILQSPVKGEKFWQECKYVGNYLIHGLLPTLSRISVFISFQPSLWFDELYPFKDFASVKLVYLHLPALQNLSQIVSSFLKVPGTIVSMGSHTRPTLSETNREASHAFRSLLGAELNAGLNINTSLNFSLLSAVKV